KQQAEMIQLLKELHERKI
ncbi:YrzO family protein, partial [Bacillus wiedmannii]